MQAKEVKQLIQCHTTHKQRTQAAWLMNYLFSVQEDNAFILNPIISCASALSLLPTPTYTISYHSARPPGVSSSCTAITFFGLVFGKLIPFSFLLILYHKIEAGHSATFLHLPCWAKIDKCMLVIKSHFELRV